MDVFTYTVTISCSVVALTYLWKVLNWVWFKPKKLEKILRQQGFKGNSYKLFYGDFKEMGRIAKEASSKPMNFCNDIAPRVIPIHHETSKKYGENSFVWFGTRPAVNITDPEIIREIMSKSYVFQKLSSNSVAKMITKGPSRGNSYDTEKWARHRKLINPAFHAEKLKLMVPSFYLSCSDMLRKWDEIVEANGGRCEVDVWPHLQTMTSDVISRTAFGSSYDEGREIFELQREHAKLLVEATRYIPGWRFVPTKSNRRKKEIVAKIDSLVIGIINKRMKAMEAGEGGMDDLLGVLLESNARGNVSGMSMEEVIEECKRFYIAGQETTASLLVWTMILLSKHDDWQARARDEVMHIFRRGENPDYQELNHLKTVNMILYEALRLYPPGVMLARSTHTEANFGKYSILAGVQLTVPVLALHHDTRLWGDDAATFKPERFAEEATQGQPKFIPFGSGPTICIGQNFAMLEAKMAMAMILQNYSFKLSPSYTHTPHRFITLQPQHGAQLILTKLFPPSH